MFENGYMLMYPSGRYNSHFYSVDANGNTKELPCIYNDDTGLQLPLYSDGLFFTENKFYNIKGEVVIDMSEYAVYGQEFYDDSTSPYFVNGKCVFKFRNNGGTLYECVIDKKGNFIEEPRAIKDDNVN